MKILANAKLNWTLCVLGARPDGYHELDMLMQSVDLCDELEVEGAPGLELKVEGADVGAAQDNLALRAARMIAPEGAGAKLRLIKRIPARAGLGGGSSDAAAALHALNRLWGLGRSLDELRELGMALGADIPYCLTGGLCRVSGLGERVERLDGAPEVDVVIAMPDAGLSTADVFKLSAPGRGMDVRAAADALRARDWAWLERNTANDLEAPAQRLSPAIARCRARMRELGAAFARMSGSGSAVFGVFEDGRADAACAALSAEYPACFRARTLR